MKEKLVHCNYGRKGCDRVIVGLNNEIAPDKFAVSRHRRCPNPNFPCPDYACCLAKEIESL